MLLTEPGDVMYAWGNANIHDGELRWYYYTDVGVKVYTTFSEIRDAPDMKWLVFSGNLCC